MKKPKQKIKTTYEEHALILHKQATAEEFKQVAKDFKAAKAATEKMETDCIAAANACRAVGIRLQTLCGHEQIDIEFWQKNDCGKKLPFDFNSARIFISIARKMPKPAKSLAEAAPLTQLMFQSANLIELAHREESQRALTVSILQKFFAEITTVRQPFEKALREQPMEKWKPSQIDSFLSETEWLSVAREKAMKVRGEMYRNG